MATSAKIRHFSPFSSISLSLSSYFERETIASQNGQMCIVQRDELNLQSCKRMAKFIARTLTFLFDRVTNELQAFDVPVIFGECNFEDKIKEAKI